FFKWILILPRFSLRLTSTFGCIPRPYPLGFSMLLGYSFLFCLVQLLFFEPALFPRQLELLLFLPYLTFYKLLLSFELGKSTLLLFPSSPGFLLRLLGSFLRFGLRRVLLGAVGLHFPWPADISHAGPVGEGKDQECIEHVSNSNKKFEHETL